jgi:hypothetical protein
LRIRTGDTFALDWAGEAQRQLETRAARAKPLIVPNGMPA